MSTPAVSGGLSPGHGRPPPPRARLRHDRPVVARRLPLVLAAVAAVLGGAGGERAVSAPKAADASAPPAFSAVIPKPLASTPGRGVFTLPPDARIEAGSGAGVRAAAAQLAALLRPPTGYALPIDSAAGTVPWTCLVPARPRAQVVARRRGVRAQRRANRRDADRAPRHGTPPRHPDAAPAAADRDRAPGGAAGPVAHPHRHDPRPAAVRVARSDARRRAALLRRRGRQALHRPARALQAEPPAPAPDGRPGLAHRDPVVAETRNARREHGGRRRPGRLLHAGGVPADRRLRRVARHRSRAGDRHAGTHARCALLVPGAELRRPPATALHRHPGARHVALRRPTAHERVRRGRPPGDRRAHTRALPAHRRRRGDGDATRGVRGVRPPRAGAGPLARQADDRLGGDRPQRPRRADDRPALAGRRPRAKRRRRAPRSSCRRRRRPTST